MALPNAVLSYLNDSAKSAGVALSGPDEDLFKSGVLDSFALVDFITILEQHSGIRVPDSDVNALNFQTIESIERYVDSRKDHGA